METTFTVRELSLVEQGEYLNGRVYLPVAEEPVPVVFYGHGFGANMGHLEAYAEHMARRGVAGVVFDFRGGGVAITSDREMTEMSVMTEAHDLELVMDEVGSWPEVDEKRMGVSGGSQGGAVAVVVAARNLGRVACQLLFYPGLAITEVYHERFASPEDIPEVFEHMPGLPVGRCYALDVWDYDFDQAMRSFEGPVLLVQGTEDPFVPPTISEHAQRTFPNARLVMVEGAGHSFADRLEEVMPLVEEFLLGSLKG